MAELTVISLGWGVQSWTMAAMSALGDLPPVDFAIHADTSWERSRTYEFAEQWTPWLEEHGVKVVTVTDDKAHGHIKDEWEGTFIPAFTLTDGQSRGQLRRQCTNRWKIQPMRRYVREVMEQQGIGLGTGVVEQWLGITMDEYQRAKDSDVQYVKHRFPLLEKEMGRADCIGWLQRHDLPSPGKSACSFCPYHSLGAWRELKREGGPDWQEAIEVDAKIRDQRPPHPLFVHPNRVPLEDAVTIPEDHGMSQLDLLESNDKDAECDSGYCFL